MPPGGPATVIPAHRSLRVVVSGKEVDLPAAKRAVADLLVVLGKDLTSEHLLATPRRVVTQLTSSGIPRSCTSGRGRRRINQACLTLFPIDTTVQVRSDGPIT